MNDDTDVPDAGGAVRGVHGHEVHVMTPSEDESVATVGDVANLIEVSGWLRKVAPAMSVEQFRSRRLPHVMTPWRVARA